MKKLLILTLVAVLGFSLFTPASLSVQADDDSAYLFDFGSPTSPIANNYTQVHNQLVYTEERGYGLSKEVDNRDRDTPDDMRRDFVIGSDYSFIVDVENGDYFIRITAGDDIAFNRSSFVINGEDYGTITSSGGDYAELLANVTVTDGKLVIDIGENGRINGLEILPATKVENLSIDSITLEAESTVSLSWEPNPAADYYQIYRKQENQDYEMIAQTNEATFQDTDVVLGETYTYAVTLVHASGIETEKSNEVTAVLMDDNQKAPRAPSKLKVTDAQLDAVSLTWKASKDALVYHVYRSSYNPHDYPEGAVKFEKIATVTGTKYTDTEILTHYPHYYQVRAVNSGGASEASAVIEAPVTKKLYRQMEKLDRALVAVSSNDGVYLGWKMLGTDPKDVKFHIYRDGKKINRVIGLSCRKRSNIFTYLQS